MSPAPGDRLDVHLGGEHAGTLEHRGPGRYRFAYEEDAVDRRGEGALLLSASLPVASGAYAPGQSRPFFEGLLPEGQVRAAAARTLGVSESNGFALLERLGGECAGAVTLTPPDAGPPRESRIDWLTDTELGAMIDELPRHPLGLTPGDDSARISLGGVQDKLVLVRDASGRYGVPKDGAPSTHILKPAHPELTDMVANEAFCMAVARCAGLPVARSEVQTVAGHTLLAVERFDRTLGGSGQLVRLHQEDTCQALGYLPGAKYEADGGPTLVAVVALLRDVGAARAARSLNTLVDAVALNVLLGNSDAHGKNFALLYQPDPSDGAQLAPLYDVVCTNVYDAFTTRLAMSVGGQSDPTEVTPDHWRTFASDAGLGANIVQRVRALAERLPDCLDATARAATAEGWHAPIIDEIRALALERVARV